MAKLVFGMSQSLDGYVDDAAGTLCMPPPGPELFRHFVDVVAGHAGAIYGRRIYEVMRYWDADRPESPTVEVTGSGTSGLSLSIGSTGRACRGVFASAWAWQARRRTEASPLREVVSVCESPSARRKALQ